MEQKIVEMIDEEIERLRQMREIVGSLLPGEQRIEPLLASAVEEITEEEHVDAAEAEPAVRRTSSRRGIRTGSRGPRAKHSDLTPRALDNVVPRGPVVAAPPAPRAVVVAPRSQRSEAKIPPSKLDSLLAAAFASQQ